MVGGGMAAAGVPGRAMTQEEAHMNDDADVPDHRMLLSRGEFHDALREAFEQAASRGCRELFISDPDFSDWPLGEIAVVDHLTRWAMSHRRLTVLARTYDELPR